MHELSIATSILDIAIAACRDQGCSSVSSIRAKIGRASGVMVEPLEFAFECAKKNTIASDAALIIEIIPLGGDCKACGSAFEVDKPYLAACPSCGSTLLRMQTGRELEVVEIEAD